MNRLKRLFVCLWEELRLLPRYIGAFSFFDHFLFLVPAMFTLQVFDRVLSIHSREMPLVLLVRTGVALSTLLLDRVRNRLQNVLGNIFDERLSLRVGNAIAAKTAREPIGTTAVATGSPAASIFSGSARKWASLARSRRAVTPDRSGPSGLGPISSACAMV